MSLCDSCSSALITKKNLSRTIQRVFVCRQTSNTNHVHTWRTRPWRADFLGNDPLSTGHGVRTSDGNAAETAVRIENANCSNIDLRIRRPPPAAVLSSGRRHAKPATRYRKAGGRLASECRGACRCACEWGGGETSERVRFRVTRPDAFVTEITNRGNPRGAEKFPFSSRIQNEKVSPRQTRASFERSPGSRLLNVDNFSTIAFVYTTMRPNAVPSGLDE